MLRGTKGFTRIQNPPLGSAARNKALRRMTQALDSVNQAIKEAVDAGVSIELILESRCHDGCGNWGDQLTSAVREADRERRHG
jgi:hypothetical protein